MGIVVDVVVDLVHLLRLLALPHVVDLVHLPRLLLLALPHVVEVDIYPSPQQIHHVLDLLQVPTNCPQMARCPTGARGEKIHSLLQVNIGHVREYQLLL